MSINSSTSNNSAQTSSIQHSLQLLICLTSPAGTAITMAFAITSLLVLFPLYIFILYKGVQQWRQTKTTMSHTDIFTYHMVVIELLSVIGSVVLTFGVSTKLSWLSQMGVVILSLNYFGQVLLHVLTCIQRYLAVVYPIIYLRLKNEKGIKIRNTAIGCFWLLSLAWGSTITMHTESSFSFIILLYTTLVLFFILVLNLSIVYVLIGLGPKREGGRKQQCDPSKLKILFTAMAILGALLFRFCWAITSIVVMNSEHIEEFKRCSFSMSMLWINLPSSLVLPVLFLQKERKRARQLQLK